MTKQETLELIFKKAEKNGFDPEGKLRQWHMDNVGSIVPLIWADDFLKAFFGDDWRKNKIEMIKYYDPLEYLDQFITLKDL